MEKYANNRNVTYFRIDVSNEASVEEARAFVVSDMEKKRRGGLFGVLQCAGIAYTAPFEYIPMDAFKKQMDVNFYGYIYVARAFLPLMKKSVSAPGARRGRMVFVSSGPLPGPGVPFITSYLAAKWAGEAVIQGLRCEFALRDVPIDCVMVSPGVVKPTRLAAEGDALLEATFKQMPAEATTEYREMVTVFKDFQMNEPGTHVSVVGQQMEKIMRHGRPYLRYYVGYDAVASIVVGVLPTILKWTLIRNTLFRKYQKGNYWTLPLLGLKIYK